MVRRRENLIAVISWLTRAVGIMADVLGARETGSINSEIRNHLRKKIAND